MIYKEAEVFFAKGLHEEAYLSYKETSQKEVKALQQKLNSDDSRFKALEKHITNTMTRISANSTKQLESFVSLQNYLLSGAQPLNFHGWPISPDIALFLIEKIEKYSYDLVLEFGSGTSTLLFAKALKGTPLVTFDHHEKYYKQTLESLKSQGLLKDVNLVYAPLKKYSFEENEYMYYDCEKTFKELSLKDEIQSVLVLVDGPPGATCPLARFPAMNYLLEAFEGKKIHLVLDDYAREEEKQTVKKWEKILNAKGVEFKSQSVASEKGLYWCEINMKKEKEIK